MDRVRSQTCECSSPESIRLQKLVGAVTEVPVAKKDSLHNSIGPTRGAGSSSDGEFL